MQMMRAPRLQAFGAAESRKFHAGTANVFNFRIFRLTLGMSCILGRRDEGEDSVTWCHYC